MILILQDLEVPADEDLNDIQAPQVDLQAALKFTVKVVEADIVLQARRAQLINFNIEILKIQSTMSVVCSGDSKFLEIIQ